MYTEEEIKALVEEEDELTDEEILLVLAALHTTLSALEDEIRNFYLLYGKDGVVTFSEVKKWVSSKNHTKRLYVLNQAISDIFEAGFDEFETMFVDHLKNIILKESDFFGVTLDIDKILNTPWGTDGLTGLQRLFNYRNKWTSIINNDLKLSFLKEDDILEVLKQAVKRGESMNVVLTRLYRSEANAISSIARKEIYGELGVKKYRFVHWDKCECEKCSDMDGQVFPFSVYEVGVTANPLHPNCRDTTQPVFD